MHSLTHAIGYMHVPYDMKCLTCGLIFEDYKAVNKFFETKSGNGVIITPTTHCPKCDSQKITALEK